MNEKSEKIVVFFLVLSFLSGAFCAFIVVKAYDLVNNLWKAMEPTTYSMNTVRDGYRSIGIILPERAWDVNYHFQPLAMDCRWYVAFSADKKDIIKIIEHYKNLYPADSPNFSIPIPKDKKDKRLKWWPYLPSDKLEIIWGEQYWVGYDKANSRVYIYKFTT